MVEKQNIAKFTTDHYRGHRWKGQNLNVPPFNNVTLA